MSCMPQSSAKTGAAPLSGKASRNIQRNKMNQRRQCFAVKLCDIKGAMLNSWYGFGALACVVCVLRARPHTR